MPRFLTLPEIMEEYGDTYRFFFPSLVRWYVNDTEHYGDRHFFRHPVCPVLGWLCEPSIKEVHSLPNARQLEDKDPPMKNHFVVPTESYDIWERKAESEAKGLGDFLRFVLHNTQFATDADAHIFEDFIVYEIFTGEEQQMYWSGLRPERDEALLAELHDLQQLKDYLAKRSKPPGRREFQR